MLDSDYLAEDYLVAVALDSIWAVLQVHGPTPLNHYCRLLSKAGLATQLLRCMRLMISSARAGAAARGGDAATPATPAADVDSRRVERAGTHLTSVCDLLLVLSHSDSVVKAALGRPENVQVRSRAARACMHAAGTRACLTSACAAGAAGTDGGRASAAAAQAAADRAQPVIGPAVHAADAGSGRRAAPRVVPQEGCQ
jgi:hypothetical protein